jgi:20S proteasome alpha/beta subunit
VIGADGLGTVGSVQVPNQKVFQIGTVYGCGVSGANNLDVLGVSALQASPLAQANAGTYTQDQATTIARDTLRAMTTAYLQHIAFVNTQAIDSQIGSAQFAFGGLCSDGPLLVSLDNRGNFGPPLRPNYTTIGSAFEAALLLMQAYSAYDFATHPLDTSVLLTKRVLEQVAAAIPNIGGTISIIAISVQAGANGLHSTFVDLNSARIQDGLATWQVLETEMFADLAAWANPPVAAPQPQAPAPPPPPPPAPVVPPVAAPAAPGPAAPP